MKRRRRESVIVRAFRHVLQERLTRGGRGVFWLLMLSNLLGGASFGIKVYLVTSGLMALLLFSVLASWLSLRRLRAVWTTPERATRGVSFDIEVGLHNEGRWPALDVVALPMPLPRPLELTDVEGVHFGTVGPGESVTGRLRAHPTRRGAYELRGLRQASVFPFGLWRSWIDHKAARTLLVYPSFRPLHRLEIEVGRRYQPGGIALTSHLGDSTEFLSTREFRYGDSLRSIHWRSWARTGKPIVKEFQEEFFCRVALVVDTFMPASEERARRAEFEAAIALTAAVADNLAREEYVIDIFAAGPELYQLQAGRSLAHFENVMDILACVEPCHEAPFEKLEAVFLESLENITTTVVLLLDWDERRQRFLRAISERGCGVKAVLVKNQLTAAEAAQVAAESGAFTHVTEAQVLLGLEVL